MLTVITPAETMALTTLDAVKDELQITDTSEDTYLQTQIYRASSVICSYLDVAPASDQSVTLGQETLLETFPPTCTMQPLYLSRRPVTSIVSVSEGDTVLDAADYAFESGRLVRADSSVPGTYWWFTSGVVLSVEYVAGWLLPNDTDRNLPLEIEMAAIELVKIARFSRSRDPALRSENILEGLYSYTLFDPQKATNPLPPSISAMIDRYRSITV